MYAIPHIYWCQEQKKNCMYEEVKTINSLFEIETLLDKRMCLSGICHELTYVCQICKMYRQFP